jgi:hypothetical protein
MISPPYAFAPTASSPFTTPSSHAFAFSSSSTAFVVVALRLVVFVVVVAFRVVVLLLLLVVVVVRIVVPRVVAIARVLIFPRPFARRSRVASRVARRSRRSPARVRATAGSLAPLWIVRLALARARVASVDAARARFDSSASRASFARAVALRRVAVFGRRRAVRVGRGTRHFEFCVRLGVRVCVSVSL